MAVCDMFCPLWARCDLMRHAEDCATWRVNRERKMESLRSSASHRKRHARDMDAKEPLKGVAPYGSDGWDD